MIVVPIGRSVMALSRKQTITVRKRTLVLLLLVAPVEALGHSVTLLPVAVGGAPILRILRLRSIVVILCSRSLMVISVSS